MDTTSIPVWHYSSLSRIAEDSSVSIMMITEILLEPPEAKWEHSILTGILPRFGNNLLEVELWWLMVSSSRQEKGKPPSPPVPEVVLAPEMVAGEVLIWVYIFPLRRRFVKGSISLSLGRKKLKRFFSLFLNLSWCPFAKELINLLLIVG